MAAGLATGLGGVLFAAAPAEAAVQVRTAGQLSKAFRSAKPGTTIKIARGVYTGTFRLRARNEIRPSRSLGEVEVSSVKKKMKDKAFARAVRREDISEGAALLGISVDEHIQTVLEAMRGIAPALGL